MDDAIGQCGAKGEGRFENGEPRRCDTMAMAEVPCRKRCGSRAGAAGARGCDGGANADRLRAPLSVVA